MMSNKPNPKNIIAKRPDPHPRAEAIRILGEVHRGEWDLDEALKRLKNSSGRAWSLEVCAGALRYWGRLEWIFASLSTGQPPSGWMKRALFIAGYQILSKEEGGESKEPLIVSETVELVKKEQGVAGGRYANGVLRNLARQKSQFLGGFPKEIVKEKDKAQWASLPFWIWRRLVIEKGESWALAFAEASLTRPHLWIRSQKENFCPEATEVGPVPRAYKWIKGGSVQKIPGFDKGEFIVQDISNQLLMDHVVKEIRKETPERRSLHALDWCAAPGGKSIALAWEGFEVKAMDISKERTLRLKENVERVGHHNLSVIDYEERDSLSLQDLVWVDAPCTGTGVLKRHPEIRSKRTAKELHDLEVIQRNLLLEAWQKVKPGGFLVYSVCSVLKSEGEALLESPFLDGRKLVKSWLFPPQDEPFGDGIFGALFQKET
jgi:16S rRNA (cytosine967-C5)-methyltransferase